MSITLRIALSILTIMYLLFIIKSIKSKKLQLSFSIFWIFIAGVMLFALIFPNIIENLSNWLGFELTSNMIFVITIFTSFYLIFNLTIKVSNDNSKIRELIQEISLLKKKVDEKEENRGKNIDEKTMDE